MTSDNQQLTPTDRRLLAREVAADMQYPINNYFNYHAARHAFLAGWDAAMEHMAKIAAEGVEHLDDNCCHFQD